jgi:hypothetical protein
MMLIKHAASLQYVVTVTIIILIITIVSILSTSWLLSGKDNSDIIIITINYLKPVDSGTAIALLHIPYVTMQFISSNKLGQLAIYLSDCLNSKDEGYDSRGRLQLLELPIIHQRLISRA